MSLVFFFSLSLRCHKGLGAFEVSPEESLDYIVISVHMFGVRFRKASEANACERGGSASVICVVCIVCVCLFVFH